MVKTLLLLQWASYPDLRCWCWLAAIFVTGSIPGLFWWVTTTAVLLVIAVNVIPVVVAKIRVLTKLLPDNVRANGKVVFMGIISCFVYDAIKAMASLST